MTGDKEPSAQSLQQLAAWAKSLPRIFAYELFEPGKGVVHAVYSHDDHCNAPRTGRGSDCNCNPDLTFHRE
jgi:hypothetical protein